MKNIKSHIRTLQELCDANKDFNEEQKIAIKAAIASLKSDRIKDALKLLVPLLGPIAKELINKWT